MQVDVALSKFQNLGLLLGEDLLKLSNFLL